MSSLGPQHDPVVLAAGNNNDVDPRGVVGNVTNIMRFEAHESGSTLTGLDGSAMAVAEGDLYLLRNIGPGTLTLPSGSNLSLLANRFFTPGGADVVLLPGGTVALDWSDKWLVSTGPTGPQGAAGPAGAAGPQGPAGPTADTVTAVLTSSATLAVGAVARVDPTGGAFSVTLPAASGVGGQTITIKNVSHSFNAITVLPTGSDTVDSEASQVLSGDKFFCGFQSDGVSDWMIVKA